MYKIAGYTSLGMVGMIGLFPTHLSASSLLATFDFPNSGYYGNCNTAGPVEFFLGLNGPGPSMYTPVGAGLAVWNHGDSGSFDITPANEPHFNNLEGTLTNGSDDLIFLLQGMTTCSPLNGGEGNFESYFFSQGGDLAGNDLDFVRLLVSDVVIETLNDDPIQLAWNASVSYEFWGSPIPEPATGTLLLIALTTSLAQCRRFRPR